MSANCDWQSLAAIEPPPFSKDGFELFNRDHWTMIGAIRSGIEAVKPADWQTASASICDFFMLDDSRQCFSEARMEWTNYLEPQITKGLVHFLDAAPTQIRKERCLAFARAVSASCKAEHEDQYANAPLKVRVEAEEKRVDVLIEFKDEHGLYGVVVEAKFNHRLTEGQLESALVHITDRGWDLGRSRFLVVGPHIDRLDCDILEKNPMWSSVTWWALLRHFERLLPVNADSGEFRRFRSTIWSQSYLPN